MAFGRTEFADYAIDTKETVFKLLNDNFDVEINGEKCEARECRVSAIPFNRPWPGKQRSIDQTESAGYISFYADEEVTIKVKSKKEFKDAKIRPVSKGITPIVSEDEDSFKLKEFGSYVLELDGTHNVLHIFYNEYKEYPGAKNATYYFGHGIHFPMIINLKDNDTVYVDKEAIVFASIFTKGAKNVKIFGGGVIGGFADMHDITFENLNIELQNDTMLQELQTADTQEYTGYDKHMETKFVACSNWQYETRVKSSKLIRTLPKKIGDIHDVYFKNINILTENIDYKPQIRIESVNENKSLHGFYFENIYLDGIKQDNFDAFNPEIINSKEITIK